MKPHQSNACAGAFPDWLDVNLLPHCNAKCAWCIERGGWHPSCSVPWERIACEAMKHGAKNILLLGGEPTLYPDLARLVSYLARYGRRVWLTTNGSKLTADFVENNLLWLSGINISIHDYSLLRNREITGVAVYKDRLYWAINQMHSRSISVRFNCNCIKGYIDTPLKMRDYVLWARNMGADSVRFCELQGTAKDFVDLDPGGVDPFTGGCCRKEVIHGLPVEIRLACGLATPCRPAPCNPEMAGKKVLYYDGVVYDGWQYNQGQPMTLKRLKDIMRMVKLGQLTEDEAAKLVANSAPETRSVVAIDVDGTGCHTGGGCGSRGC